MKQDLCFKVNSGVFQSRVGAIITNKDKILVVQNNVNPHYYTIGGKIGFNEDSKEALKREIVEELGIDLEILNLAYVQENIFSHEGRMTHEVAFFYNVKFDSRLLNIQKTYEEKIEETLHWIRIEDLNDYVVYPDFLKNELVKSNFEIKHIVSRRN